MQVTSVINQKGGVGKTALSVGVAAALAEQGRRVLLIDLDPQGHATTEFLGLPEVPPGRPSLPMALSKMWKGPVSELAVPHQRSNIGPGGCLHVIPTAPGMFDLIRRQHHVRVPTWELARVLQFADYQHIIIDCPPALDLLTNNALAATDGVLVPVQPDRTSIRAVRLLTEQVRHLEQRIDRPPIEYFGLVPGLYRRPLSAYSEAVLRAFQGVGMPILAHVPMGVVVNEAAERGMPVTTYAPQSPQAVAMRQVARVVDGHLARRKQQRRTYVPNADFEFEDFITEVAGVRRRTEAEHRSGLYDLMPRRSRR
ncbi:ParA family protein [Thermocrispum municipale]|jgi:chromosome partitioning protein|uniref:ParA family protein n=1 Tax=Thermocrispum municipale TaxID=37926 RepID=UPI000419C9C9|nr:ParA family protein [Thermocrispum municipale]